MNENAGQGGVVSTQQSGPKVLILGHKCYRCGHEWRPNDIDVLPRVCPSCKNPYWDRPKRKSSEKRAKTHEKNSQTTRKNG